MIARLEPAPMAAPASLPLSELVRLLCEMGAEPLHLTIRHAGMLATISVQPDIPATQPEQRSRMSMSEPSANGHSGLTRLEESILRTATRKPTPAKQLARSLSRSCNSHFRDGLRALCRREPALLVRTPDGYRLA